MFANPLEIKALKSGHHSIEKESRWRRNRKKPSFRRESNLRPLDHNNRSPTQTFSSKNNVPRIRQKYVFDNMCPIPGRIFFVFNPSESFFLSIFAFADLAWPGFAPSTFYVKQFLTVFQSGVFVWSALTKFLSELKFCETQELVL